MFIDTHTHFYARRFDHDRDAAMQRALDQGVEAFYLPNIDTQSTEAMLALEAAHPDRCFAMMGLHPCSVKPDTMDGELARVRQWLDRRPFCAVGEIGIDLYWDKSTLDLQREAFLRQIDWARELDRPIVIHSRDSTQVIIDLLAGLGAERPRGIFHCFTGNVEQGKAILDLGFLLGIGGVLTFKNSGLDATLRELPLAGMVLETDAPYLAPSPHRGRRNESSYIPLIAQRLAELKETELEEVARITTDNALRVFGPEADFLPVTGQRASTKSAGNPDK